MSEPASLTTIRAAADILRNGGIVVYPTETVYGIGCDPLNVEACSRVRRLKGRDESKPFILIADSCDSIVQFAGAFDDVPRKLARKFWPGPLTLVLRPSNPLPGHLKGPTGGVAFRATPHPVAALLSRDLGLPVVSTSANMTAGTPVTDFDAAVRLFGSQVDMVLENIDSFPGELIAGEPSTVVDCTVSPPRILRAGAIAGEDILREV